MSTAALAAVASAWAALVAPTAEAAVSIYGRSLPDEPVEYLEDEEGLASETPPIVLFGDPFLIPGNLSEAIELPTGAVWTPSLWLFGQGRTVLQTQDTGDPKRRSEWANTLDLFANLQLTGTERVLLGITPLRRGFHFSGYRFEPDSDDGGFSRLGANITTLLVEGDFGELFPNLDPTDQLGLDYGFAVGRQALSFQQDVLINDTVDGVGIVRNNLTIPGTSNVRITGFYGWDEITRPNNFVDENANLFGLFTQADTYFSTLAFDLAYVDGDETSGDGLYAGVSAVQRFGLWTSSVRLLMSQNVDGKDTTAVRDGLLLFVDFSTTPLGTDDILYLTFFGAMDEFTQAAKDQTVGGPLTRAGILFASPQLGTYVGPLSARANDVIGFSVGRQWFLVPNNREQLVIEAGARWDVGGNDFSSAGLAGRYQIQIHNQAFWQFELYGTVKETEGPGYGARSEIQFRF